MLVNSGLTNVLLPRLVLLRSEERYIEAEQLAHRLMWMIAGIFVLYTALVVLADGRLTSLVLGDTYTGLESFIVAWAAVNLLTALRGNKIHLIASVQGVQNDHACQYRQRRRGTHPYLAVDVLLRRVG